jgi:hypothetical protein
MIEQAPTVATMHPEQILAASAPLPDALQLLHGVQGRAARQTSAWAAAWVSATIGVMACLLIFYMFGTEAPLLAIIAGVAVMIWMAVRGYRKQNNAPGQLWEVREWIDFRQRIWHRSKRHDRSGPLDMRHRVSLDTDPAAPLDTLALYCSLSYGDADTYYHVGLCKLADLKRRTTHDPECLSRLHTFLHEQEAITFAGALAALWGIPSCHIWNVTSS